MIDQMTPVDWHPPGPDADLLGPRDRLSVHGSDAATYLQSQVSQDLSAMAVGDDAWTFVLEPNGRIAALARVVRVGDDSFELDTDAGFGHGLLDRLARFRIRVDVTFELEPASNGLDADGRSVELERRRIAAGWPRMGHELIPDETLVAGTGLARLAVSFTKGCYPGQELVERMDARGAQAPSRLYSVVVADDARAGDPVIDGAGEPVGTLTSVGDGHGLAWIRRNARPDPTTESNPSPHEISGETHP